MKGSVVSYTNEVKEQVLGVPRKILDQHGAVSGRWPELWPMGQGVFWTVISLWRSPE